MVVHKTCRGLVEAAVTSGPKFHYYCKLAPTVQGNHHVDSIRTKLNWHEVQKLHSVLGEQCLVTKHDTKHGLSTKYSYKTTM
jgi:hypothetical protein